MANENAMLWARGLVDSPSYMPFVARTRVKSLASLQKDGLSDSVLVIAWPLVFMQHAKMGASRSMWWKALQGNGRKGRGRSSAPVQPLLLDRPRSPEGGSMDVRWCFRLSLGNTNSTFLTERDGLPFKKVARAPRRLTCGTVFLKMSGNA